MRSRSSPAPALSGLTEHDTAGRSHASLRRSRGFGGRGGSHLFPEAPPTHGTCALKHGETGIILSLKIQPKQGVCLHDEEPRSCSLPGHRGECLVNSDLRREQPVRCSTMIQEEDGREELVGDATGRKEGQRLGQTQLPGSRQSILGSGHPGSPPSVTGPARGPASNGSEKSGRGAESCAWTDTCGPHWPPVLSATDSTPGPGAAPATCELLPRPVPGGHVTWRPKATMCSPRGPRTMSLLLGPLLNPLPHSSLLMLPASRSS